MTRKQRLVLAIFCFSTFLTIFVNYRTVSRTISRRVGTEGHKAAPPEESFYIDSGSVLSYSYNGDSSPGSKPKFTSPLDYRRVPNFDQSEFSEPNQDLADVPVPAAPAGEARDTGNSYSFEVSLDASGSDTTPFSSQAANVIVEESPVPDDDELVMSQTLSAPHRNNSIVCTNSEEHTRETQTIKRASFTIVVNFVKGSQEVKCDESITYSTHGDFRFLDNLVPLVERWEGPISIALYAPLMDLQPTIEAIIYLRECTTPLIKEWVTFHVFADTRFFTNPMPYLDQIMNQASVDPDLCSRKPEFGDDLQNERTKRRLLYPVNVARNVARQAAMTHYVLASDIELYPSLNIIPRFLDMISNNKSEALHRPNPRIFTLPVFEVKSEVRLPDTKEELVNMIRHKEAFSFHRKLCSPCHRIPMYFQWLKSNTSKNPEIDVFVATKRRDRYKRWEPIFIGTNDEPAFDERLSWEGQRDKMTQNYILCVMDYDYMILDNAFLVHKPGIKPPKEKKKKPDRAVRKQNRIYKKIATELDKIYEKRDGCEL